MLEKIHCKLQETCCTLQSWVVTCNGHKKCLQSLQEVELSSTVSVTRCNFLCNGCCNGVARKVEGRLKSVTCPLCNLSHNFFRLAKIAQSRARFYLLQRLQGIVSNKLQVAACDLHRVTCLLQLARISFSNVERRLLEKMTPAYSVKSLQAQKSCEISCKEGVLHHGLFTNG